MQVSNKWYDRLKYIQMIFLPALAAAILALNSYWDIPNQDRIVGTIGVVAVFMGALLRKAANDYGGAGDLILHKDLQDGQVYLSADWDVHPDTLKEGQNVTLNVKRENISA